MRKHGLLILLPFCLWGEPVRAALPDFILDKDYNACIADGSDSARNAYCGCVRDHMRGWSMDQYMALVAEATQASLAGGKPAVPARLQALAESCLPGH